MTTFSARWRYMRAMRAFRRTRDDLLALGYGWAETDDEMPLIQLLRERAQRALDVLEGKENG